MIATSYNSNFFILSLILAYFLIGGVGMMVYASRVDNEKKKYLWTKYFFYVLLIYLLLTTIIFFPFLFPYLGLLIALIGFWEVVKVSDYSLLVLLLYLHIAIAFVVFCFVASFVFILHVYVLILTFDGFSQIVGQLIKGPKLIPLISPNKTLSGFIGGLLIALLTAFVLNGMYAEVFWQAMIIILAGFAGDIIASYLKRKMGVKDYSQLIPGHGGVLDRFDSFIFAGAVMLFFI